VGRSPSSWSRLTHACFPSGAYVLRPRVRISCAVPWCRTAAPGCRMPRTRSTYSDVAPQAEVEFRFHKFTPKNSTSPGASRLAVDDSSPSTHFGIAISTHAPICHAAMSADSLEHATHLFAIGRTASARECIAAIAVFQLQRDRSTRRGARTAKGWTPHSLRLIIN
jgi:hypothetical protein